MVNLCKHRARMVKENAAGFGQFDPARLAAEQLRVDFAFDRPDLTAKWWRLHTEPLRGPREVLFLSDRYDVAKLPQLQSTYPKGNDYGSTLAWLDMRQKAIALLR